MMKKILLLGVFMIICFSTRPQTPLLIAPHFEAKDFNGNPHELYTYLNAGKYVLLNFFTTSCGTCLVYNPHVNQAYIHYGCNTGNLKVLGINWGSTNALVAQYHQANGLSFPALSGQDGYGNEIAEQYQIASFISVILIAPNRQIVHQYIYPPTFETLQSVISSYGIGQSSCAVGTNQSIIALQSDLIIYPNPATSYVKINSGSYTSRISSLVLFDLTGRVIRAFDEQSLELANSIASLAVKGISAGYYTLHIGRIDGIHEMRKLLIIPE
ncbi:MAG: redoxin domain-containing protein [Bacteroidales bacterium]|nr:redoxin domain-containing protein [Bacteroidales bacterium]